MHIVIASAKQTSFTDSGEEIPLSYTSLAVVISVVTILWNILSQDQLQPHHDVPLHCL